MFKKILVVEDIDSINIGVANTLKESFSLQVHHANYCDKAFLKIKKALQDQSPYDLLITDLSFTEDHIATVIKSGEDLIGMVRGVQPTIKVIIYSIEDRPLKIRQFMDQLGVNGYVLKGRNSSKDLVEAIKVVDDHRRYVSPQLQFTIKRTPALEIDSYDLELLKELANGLSQQEIGALFLEKGISPTSLSSIEKRLNKLKDYFMAKNTPHLVAIAKDMGLF